MKVTSQYPSQRNILNFVFCGIWLIPFVLAVVFSKDWPGFWQGRYSLPFLMGAILILISNSNPIDLHIPATFLFLSNVYLILLTFARFNWGLYGTNTPIISNGWSFSSSVTATFFALIAVYLLSTVYFLKQQIVIFQNISPIS